MAATDLQRHPGPGHWCLSPNVAGGNRGADRAHGGHARAGVAAISPSLQTHVDSAGDSMKKVLRITEAEVVAEFLKAEFYRPEFDRDRQKVWDVVQHPNLDDETENAIRRGLLFRR